MSTENFKNTIEEIKGEKAIISGLIDPHLPDSSFNHNQTKQKRRELIDVAKFINASKENIKILDSDFKIPDLLIEWNNEKYGLEHTEVIDQKKKDTHEKTEGLIKEAEKVFTERYGDIGRHINFSLKFEVTKISKREKRKLLNNLLIDFKDLNWERQKLMNMAHPGYLTEEDITMVAGQLADMAFIVLHGGEIDAGNGLVNYITVKGCKQTLFTRSVAWGAGSISDAVIECIEDKEAKIESYIKNTNGLKQCLFLLIQGSNGYSDYSFFDDKILQERGSKFDKVIAFNFFNNEFFILK